MASPANVITALTTAFNTAFPSMPLRYGRRQEGDTRPYAILEMIPSTAVKRGFGSGIIDEWVFQFTLFDDDGVNLAANLNTLNIAFDRQPLTLTGGGTCKDVFRIQTNFSILPQEDATSNDVYQGWIRFRVRTDQ